MYIVHVRHLSFSRDVIRIDRMRIRIQIRIRIRDINITILILIKLVKVKKKTNFQIYTLGISYFFRFKLDLYNFLRKKMLVKLSFSLCFTPLDPNQYSE